MKYYSFDMPMCLKLDVFYVFKGLCPLCPYVVNYVLSNSMCIKLYVPYVPMWSTMFPLILSV